MKIAAIVYLIGFITAWGPVVMLSLANLTPLNKISPERRIDIFGYAARATLIGFWVMLLSGSMLVVMVAVELVKYFSA